MYDSDNVGSSLSVVWYDNLVVILRARPGGDEFTSEYCWHDVSDHRNVGCDRIVFRIRKWQDARTRMFVVCHLGSGFDMDSCHRRLGVAIGIRETH